MNKKQVRAIYTDTTIRVYQAFRKQIAVPALRAGTFVEPFKMSRMTWIKPSFCWMMYRCGYASKEDQEMVLAIDIDREGFDWVLRNGVLASHVQTSGVSHESWKESLINADVRLQWDPERDIYLEKMTGSGRSRLACRATL